MQELAGPCHRDAKVCYSIVESTLRNERYTYWNLIKLSLQIGFGGGERLARTRVLCKLLHRDYNREQLCRLPS